MSAIYLIKNQVYHERMKHIDVRFHFIREIFDEGDIELQKVHVKRIPWICLPRWFWEWNLHNVKSCFISFQMLEFGGAHFDELRLAWSLG